MYLPRCRPVLGMQLQQLQRDAAPSSSRFSTNYADEPLKYVASRDEKTNQWIQPRATSRDYAQPTGAAGSAIAYLFTCSLDHCGETVS